MGSCPDTDIDPTFVLITFCCQFSSSLQIILARARTNNFNLVGMVKASFFCPSSVPRADLPST